METTDETPMTEQPETADEHILMEATPYPPEEAVQEFEEFLMEIGLRF